MRSTSFSKFLWLYPFLVFFSTYFMLHVWFGSHLCNMPNITGLHLVDATKILSQHKLHPEIIQIKEDKDLPEATIIHQTPPADRTIKKHQTVYLVISQKPIQHKVPYCIGLPKEQIKQIATAFGFKPKFYEITYPYPTDQCFAQWPTAGQTDKNRSLICYMAKREKHMLILPNFKGKMLNEAQAFVELHDIALQTDLAIQPGKNYYIQDQQPKSGTFMDTSGQLKPTLYLTLTYSH